MKLMDLMPEYGFQLFQLQGRRHPEHIARQRQESMNIKLAGSNLFSGERERTLISAYMQPFPLDSL